MKIEIITTPNEELKESGFGILNTCNGILDSITSMGHSVTIEICQTKEHLNAVVKRKPDLVILAVKYVVTEDGETIWLSEFFAENKINFSGSSKDTLMYGADKVLAKSYLKDKGISTPRYFTAIPGEHKRDFDIPINYPLFLKPSHSLNYKGKDELLPVNNFVEFEKKVSSLYHQYKLPVLVEEYIDGEDYTVSIMQAQGGDILVSAVEITESKPEKRMMIQDEEIKKNTKKKLICIKDKATKNRIENLAIDAYIDLKIRDFGQIDIKTNKSGHCYFMQANLAPGMTNGTSHFPEAIKIELGLSYDEIIKLIVDEGISRV